MWRLPRPLGPRNDRNQKTESRPDGQETAVLVGSMPAVALIDPKTAALYADKYLPIYWRFYRRFCLDGYDRAYFLKIKRRSMLAGCFLARDSINFWRMGEVQFSSFSRPLNIESQYAEIFKRQYPIFGSNVISLADI